MDDSTALPPLHMEIPRLCTSSGLPSPLPDECLPPRDISAEYLDAKGSNIIHKYARALGEIVTKSCYLGRSTLIRGDIAPIDMGFGVFIEDGALIRPPLRFVDRRAIAEGLKVTIGSMVYIGPNVISEAHKIDNFVIIEADAILGERCVIRHGATVRAGAVVPPGMVVPPFSIVEGNPARVVGRVREDVHPILVREFISQQYQSLSDPSVPPK